MKKIDKEYINGKKPTRQQRKLRTIYGFVVLVGLTLIVTMSAFSPTVSADSGIPGEEIAAQETLGATMLVIGILLGVVILIATKGEPLDSGMSTGVSIVSVLLIAAPAIMGVAVAVSGPSVDVAFCDKPENATNPVCVDKIPLKWTVLIEADLDVAGATYPAAPMTICDTAIGGTTGEWVAADNGNVENDQMMVTTGVHQDTDIDDTNALWQEPNCVFIETSRVQLTQGPYASGGALETQFYYARIDSISLTRLPNDNATVTQSVFYEDTEGRHHIGYQFEDGSWNEACPEYRGMALPTTGCAPI
ncbi:MAG: hypothetical protein ACXABY_07925, partial [Candidatus Thorarchaeota archaeon]